MVSVVEVTGEPFTAHAAGLREQVTTAVDEAHEWLSENQHAEEDDY